MKQMVDFFKGKESIPNLGLIMYPGLVHVTMSIGWKKRIHPKGVYILKMIFLVTIEWGINYSMIMNPVSLVMFETLRSFWTLPLFLWHKVQVFQLQPWTTNYLVVAAENLKSSRADFLAIVSDLTETWIIGLQRVLSFLAYKRRKITSKAVY